MAKLNLAISGASGRVGKELLAICESSSEFHLSLQGDHHRPICELKDIDVVVDFSSPKALSDLLVICADQKVPLVSGTTGLSEEDRKQMKKTSAKTAILWASNMSLGINFVVRLLKNYGALKDFDFQIEEAHHRHKVDAPSGTAMTLQEELQKVCKNELPPPLSLRGGGIFGIHKIWAMSEEEVISLEHQALNRKVFAKGALVAAQWIVGKSAGLYGMQDVLDSELS
ncbi:MAG: 4-hydroxy-tetrahydrodipicolinate reductase [Bdellovibrionales bacterium]|nr:4-hydroxy-tetrahydrodipicolinate reductase [Bdellovibrionales bacterium]